jgi:hypothetical protein
LRKKQPLNQENITKNEMIEKGAMEVERTKENTTTRFDRNG